MNGNPSKAQRDWHQWLREDGCTVQGGMSDNRLSIHHIKGSKMKLKGVPKAGEWYVLCLSYWWHQDGTNPAARHVNKRRFERESGATEKEWFIIKVNKFEGQHGRKPMSDEIFNAIVDRA